MHTWRPSLLRISSQLGIMKRLVRRLNQPMTATLIKTARSLNITLEQDRIFSAALPRLLPQLRQRHKGWFHWSNAVRWCVTWKITNVVNVKRGQRTYFEENGTICLLSNSNLYREKRHNKTQKSDNNKQTKLKKQTKEGSRASSQPTWTAVDPGAE